MGDIALARSDHETARSCYEEALVLYQRIAEPYSIGWAYVRLALLAEDAETRDLHIAAARESWENINRLDLIERLGSMFPDDPPSENDQ